MCLKMRLTAATFVHGILLKRYVHWVITRFIRKNGSYQLIFAADSKMIHRSKGSILLN